MTIHILDSSAMIAYLVGEPGEDVVAKLLTHPDAVCYAHSINLCEVYYDTLRATGGSRAKAVITTLIGDGVIERSDMTRAFWESAGVLKSRGGISLADCFGIALAQMLGGEIVTSDHHEFDRLAAQGVVPIRFIR